MRRRSAILRLGLVAACVSGANACWMSAADGEKLQTAAEARDRRIGEIESENREIREEAVKKIRELEDVLARATELLQRNSADVGAQVQHLEQQVAAVEGQIAELRHELDRLAQEQAAQRTALEQKTTAQPREIDPAQVPADKEAHYNSAYQAYEAGDHEKARGLFREFLKRYPTDTKAGTAQYWIGSSYLQQERPATALGEYRKVIADYAKSDAVDVALYGMADAFYRLHACTDAKAAIDALLARKPKRALADRTKALRKKLDEAEKGYCTS